MFKTQAEFAVAMSVLLFEMRIESDTPYGDHDDPVPQDFAEAVIDDPVHIAAIKKAIETSILKTLEVSPMTYFVHDSFNPHGGYYSYCSDTYDHAFAVDNYVQDRWDDTQTRTVYQCQHCRGDNVRVRAWVKPNCGNQYLSECDEAEPGWCDDCQLPAVIDTVEVKKRARIIGFQVESDGVNSSGEIHPEMDASFCVYNLSQAREMMKDQTVGERWKLLAIWDDTIEEPTMMFEGAPRA